MTVLIVHSLNQKIEHIRQGLLYQNIQSHTYCFFGDGESAEAQNAVAVSDYNAVIFYVRGTTSCAGVVNAIKELRIKHISIPFIAFDESGDIELKSVLMNSGIDAFFLKPFIFSEIASEIKRLAYRKSKLLGKKLLSYGDLKLDLLNRAAKRMNKNIRLRNKEFALLEFLMINKGQIVTRDLIIDYVWDRNARLLSNTIDVHIGALRRKIEQGFKRKLIHTIHCVGYKLSEKR
ncbi:MAG: response regulator transcription factor [Patescibacteria group bacterium]